MEKRTPQKQLGKEVLQDAYDRLKLDFDPDNGGFGTAPKFPTPHKLLFLLRYYARTGEKKALDMAEKTLRQMRLGGIFDQIGLASTVTALMQRGWCRTSKKCSMTKLADFGVR